MKFSISSGELVKGLSAVNGAVPNKATLPILETVLFETEDGQLKLTATDLEISIIEYVEANIEEDGSVAIPVRRLLETLRQLPDIPVVFIVDDRNQIQFKTDRGTYKLIGEKGEEFPAVPSLENGHTLHLETESLKDAIHKTSFAVSTDDLRPAMMGVYFQVGAEGSRVVATDGHRLVRLLQKDMVSEKELSFIVPEKALSLVLKSLSDNAADMTVTDDHVRFQSGNTIVVTRLINEQYPNYESVIPRENDKVMKISKDEMLATVKRVSIFSSTTTRQIRLQLGNDEVEICAEDIDMSSEAKETIGCEYSDGEMVIGFNAKYLADVLNNVDDEDVRFEFSTPNRAGIVKPSAQNDKQEMLMLVMPVMLNTYA